MLLECSAAPAKSLDGIAVVSALVAAEDPAAAARDLLAKVVTGRVPDVLRAVAEGSPLSHNMTNLVRSLFSPPFLYVPFFSTSLSEVLLEIELLT